MKRYTNLLFSLLMLVVLGACDYLDYDESSYMLEEDVFSEFSRTKNMLTHAYSQLPHDFSTIDGAMRSSGTDEAVHVDKLSNIIRFTNGTWSPIQTVDAQWESMYSGIYNINLFLKQVEDKTWEELKWNDDYEEKMAQFELYPYEGRVLRAYFYFELFRRYGGVPLVTKQLTEEEANDITRASAQEIADFIVDECDAAIAILPDSYESMIGTQEVGRVTKGAAMALKARTLLYMASPLHNSTGDMTQWEEAAVAAKEIIDSHIYALEDDYADVVNNGESKELIFSVRQNESNSFEMINFPVGYEGGNTGTCPSHNLVSAYEMLDTGLPIDNQASGYDPNFPYEGRDPRLSETVLVNGSVWKGEEIEIWHGGANAEPKQNASRTGYYLKKYVVESVNLETGNTSKKRPEWVLFRLGEVYLNYAEAMNEATGGPEIAGAMGMTALEAVNAIRQRAGMPDFPSGMSQDEFRKKLQNERRVELAFEDHRFWDVRRWKIGDETTEISGITASKQAYGDYEYAEKLLENRVWDERMNFYPIPQSEIFKNAKLTQNPGWE